MLLAALGLLVQSARDLSADLEVLREFEVKLWAESPQLYNPTSLDVDDLGRVWVTEAVNYRLWNNPGARRRPEGDRVVVLEDTDQDERCDSSRVFAQGPELVAPLGILVQTLTRPLASETPGAPRSERVGERVYVSCSPSILVYEDRNGDGDALDPGEKEVFLTGFGGFDHDHGVHSLVLGRDGRLYFTVGNAGPHVVTDRRGWTLRSGSVYREGGEHVADNKPGLVSDDGRVWTGGLILSVQPDGADLRVEAHNFRNPYEVELDPYGDLFTFDNDDEVSACRASWVMRGGNYGFFSADGSRTWRADRRPGQSVPVAQWHADDPGVVPSGTLTGAGGPTGVLVYAGGLGREMHGGALLCADAGRGEVLAFERENAGSEVRLRPAPSVLRARATSDARGARWFRPSDLATDPYGVLFVADWFDPGVGGHGMADGDGLGRILRVSPWGHGPKTFPAPPQVVGLSIREDKRSRPREDLASLRHRSLEAEAEAIVRIARGYDGKDRAYLEGFGLACEGREEAVYALLARELGDVPSRWSPAFAGLAWRLHPPSAVPAFVARAMDASLAKEARKQSIDALAFVKTKEAAEGMANLAAASPEDLRPHARWWLENRATNDWSGWVDREALGGGLEDAELAWRSGVIRSGRHAVDVDVRGATRLWLVVSEGEHGMDYDWADWLAPRFEGGEKSARLVELGWLEARSGWGDTQAGLSCEGGPLVVEGETHADGIGTHARSEIAFAVPPWAEHFRAVAAPDDMGSKRAGSTNELEFQVWLERPPSRERVERLTRMAFEGQFTPEMRLDALGELALDPEGGLVVIGKAERGLLGERQKRAVAERIFQNPDLGVRARASAVFQRPGERPRPSVEALLALRGDAGRGRELFLDPRAQCSTCHSFEHGGRRRGGDIGPDLTGVRTKLDAARIFDAILNPSAEIAHGFETWLLETRDGALLGGFVLADGPTVILKDTQGKRHALAAGDVVARTRERVSTMPDGVAAGLTDQELADLVAFLRDDPAREPEFGPEVALWNGRDFTGWTFHLDAPGAKLADVWSVQDGELVCKGNPIGYLRTEAKYTSFELTLEWRFDPARGAGNSGVLLRQIGPDRVWPTSIEAQLQHQNAGDIWNIGAFPMAVDEERTDGRHTARAQPSSERALGEWNRYRIRLDRGLLTLEVNGVVQNTASWCREVAGSICLQSEGAEIHFRELRLRPIVN